MLIGLMPHHCQTKRFRSAEQALSQSERLVIGSDELITLRLRSMKTKGIIFPSSLFLFVQVPHRLQQYTYRLAFE